MSFINTYVWVLIFATCVPWVSYLSFLICKRTVIRNERLCDILNITLQQAQSLEHNFHLINNYY